MINVQYELRTYLIVHDRWKLRMTKNKDLIVIGSEDIQLKNNKGLAKQSTLGNSISNMILEQIHQVLGNLVSNFII